MFRLQEAVEFKREGTLNPKPETLNPRLEIWGPSRLELPPLGPTVGLELETHTLRFRVQGLRFRVQGSGFRV